MKEVTIIFRVTQNERLQFEDGGTNNCNKWHKPFIRHNGIFILHYALCYQNSGE